MLFSLNRNFFIYFSSYVDLCLFSYFCIFQYVFAHCFCCFCTTNILIKHLKKKKLRVYPLIGLCNIKRIDVNLITIKQSIDCKLSAEHLFYLIDTIRSHMNESNIWNDVMDEFSYPGSVGTTT